MLRHKQIKTESDCEKKDATKGMPQEKSKPYRDALGTPKDNWKEKYNAGSQLLM